MLVSNLGKYEIYCLTLLPKQGISPHLCYYNCEFGVGHDTYPNAMKILW